MNSEGPKAPSRFMEQREVTIRNIYWGAIGGRNQQSTTQPPLSSPSPWLNIRGDCVCVCVWSLCCVWFFANPMDHSPPGPSVHGISQARILEWAAISYSRASSWLRDQTTSLVSPAPAGRIFATAPHVINEWHSWAWNQASQYGHSVNIYWVTVRFCMVPSAEIKWWTKIFTVINLVKFSFLDA